MAQNTNGSQPRLPHIDRPAEPHFSIHQMKNSVGKTIERVEYGFREPIRGVHQGEAMILYFTDGSRLGIDTGSNATNLAKEHKDLRADDFHTDFMLTWVPASY